ncbi:unnamed protein product [Zymoseptoria tritici ST99CH_1E4]|uniref:Uncharacterized protein n=1 Tax=Zymoseptoria tritici ST99CH_1E4 TaxID=1276532 RepID=A0A2H1GHC0_ZYMTR|nr:unnamed protein product [Zymoseptoria tritici ST99CH_1E4]
MRVVSTGKQSTALYSCLEHIGTPLICLLLVALFTGLFFSRALPHSDSGSSNSKFSCSADGKVIPPLGYPKDQNWDPRLFLSITLAFGNLNFPQAKAIDVCWDFAIGRGGQALVAILVYPTMRKSLLTLLEKRPLRMPLVTSLTFEHFSVWSWWALAKEMIHSWSWRLSAYLYIVSYLLAFGTLVPAMTGYQAKQAPFYRSGNNLMDYSKVRLVPAATVTDADRLGLPSQVTVWGSTSDPNYPLWNYTALAGVCNSTYRSSGIEANGTLRSNDTVYGDVWSGTYAPTEVSDLFTIDWFFNQTPPDSRSASTYASRYGALGWRDCTTSNITIANYTHSLRAPPLHFEYQPDLYLDENGKVLDEHWLQKVSTCQTLETYQWGFSSLMLFTFCMATAIFLTVLLTLNLDIYLNSQVNRVHQDFSLHRDILDYASEIQAEVGKDKADSMPSKVLESYMGSLSAEARVSAYEYPPSRAQTFRKQHGRRFRRLRAELRAGHAYSMGEMKRSLGLTYGPVPKASASDGFDDVRLYDVT